MSNLEKIRELVFEIDNNACFIERERVLSRLEDEMKDYTGDDKYAIILSKVLDEVSTPILDCDYFAGRVVEALPDDDLKVPMNMFLYSIGHMSFDYEKMLKIGLKGILAEIKDEALKKGDKESLSFSNNAEIVVNAIKKYCDRYSAQAQLKGNEKMAKALKTVPFEPAYDFYSALQGIWIIHMIASCYVGARDYAFGRFDQYMLPFYEKAINEGKTREDLTQLLAGFLIKTNEICGRCTWNHETKPILSQASKQYINIGGEKPNVFSSVVLDAAMLSNMAQPQIIVLLKPDADEDFTNKSFEALSVLHDKMNFYNYNTIVKTLLNKGICEEVAKDFTYSACCTFDLNYHTFRHEYFAPVPFIFNETLESGEFNSLGDVILEFKKRMTKDIQDFVNTRQEAFLPEDARKMFVLDSILLSDSAKECRYPCDAKSKYNMINIFCPGIATMGDSLMVLDKLVFKEKRYTYSQFIDIVKNDYENHEELRQEILSFEKFGNDTIVDNYATIVAEAFLDVTDSIKLKDNFYIAAGFYSLDRDNLWSSELGATLDGRKAGEPFSENQSPTYGADKNGITALLKSISKLPLRRTITGGLNLTFSQKISKEILKALVVSYFEMGGLHVGISIVDKDVLRDAMVNPDKYKSLTVRLYGFSEYFVSLPKWQQIAVLNRTEYN